MPFIPDFLKSAFTILTSVNECLQEDTGILTMNSIYGSNRASQDSDNVIILQDRELASDKQQNSDPLKYLQVTSVFAPFL